MVGPQTPDLDPPQKRAATADARRQAERLDRQDPQKRAADRVAEKLKD